ncbi:MAG: hypothetical protein GXO12_02305 [Epsilonproteobacteria bacterium]|nr:hypothetical protein [Campylobacterota bacterium]
MKGFLIFLLLVFIMIGLFLTYQIYHPSNTQYVRRGLDWVRVDVNLSKK